MTDTSFESCDLSRSDMRRARLINTRISGGDWSMVWLERGRLMNSKVVGVTFEGVHIYDALLDGTEFVNCNFQKAFLSMRDPGRSTHGWTRKTVFKNCDFSGATFAGRKLQDTVFERCAFDQVTGTPQILGAYTVVAPDFSKAGDGSDVRTAKAVYDLWGKPR
jgi:uncharacterized protein YjbI with pentapeptide repeats